MHGAGEDGGPSDLMPGTLAESVGEFVAAWAGVERHGVQGWIVVCGGGELADEFGDALAVFCGELNRLEFEDDVARALAEAEERKR